MTFVFTLLSTLDTYRQIFSKGGKLRDVCPFRVIFIETTLHESCVLRGNNVKRFIDIPCFSKKLLPRAPSCFFRFLLTDNKNRSLSFLAVTKVKKKETKHISSEAYFPSEEMSLWNGNKIVPLITLLRCAQNVCTNRYLYPLQRTTIGDKKFLVVASVSTFLKIEPPRGIFKL